METWGLAGDSFILPSPWDLVTPAVTTTTTTTPPPIGPLGFSIITTTTTTTTSTLATIVKTAPVLDDVKSLDPTMVASAAVTLLSDILQPALLGLLSFWLLAGGLWAFLTHLSINNLRKELESLSFLFMPQATVHQLSKSSMGEAMDEMDRILAKLFMNLPPEKTSTPRGGPLDLVLRGLMLLLSLATGVLQSARHLLGMLIMKTIPESGTMGDYHSWLDNIAAADMRASKYFVDKGPNGSSASLPEEFPNFQNQFLSGDFSGF